MKLTAASRDQPPDWVNRSTKVEQGKDVNHQIPGALAETYRVAVRTPVRGVAPMSTRKTTSPQTYTYAYRHHDGHVDRWYVERPPGMPRPRRWDIHVHPNNRVRALRGM